MTSIAPKSPVRFDRFEVDPARRLLLRDGDPVSVQAKTFDLLLELLGRPGEVVSKDELLSRVWADQFVEENNLTVHVAALRKALGERRGEHRFIVTVPGRGYRFVGDISGETADDIVIETHEIQRILIDDDVEVSVGDRRIRPARRPFLVPALFGIALVLALSMFLAFSLRGGSSEKKGETSMRQFVTQVGIPQRVAISRDGSKLVYVQREKGADSIWIGDVASGQNFQITQPKGRAYNALHFSPDGKWVYFTVRDDENLKFALKRVSALGGAESDIFTGVRGDVSLSADGGLATFLTDGENGSQSLVVVRTGDGGIEKTLLTLNPPAGFGGGGPMWSPDGKSIAVGMSDAKGNGCDVVLVSPDDGSQSKFGEGLCRNAMSFDWIRDGTGMLITAAPDASSSANQVWKAAFPSGEKIRLTNDTSNYATVNAAYQTNRAAVLERINIPDIGVNGPGGPRIIVRGALRAEGTFGVTTAPDGKIVFTIGELEGRGIWEMKADGSGQRQLISSNNEVREQQPVVTPDNRYLVFSSNRSGTSEIWRAEREGSALTQLTRGGGSSEPALSPDGKHVYYTVRRDGPPTIWRIPVEGGEPEQITRDDTSWPDVSPDGRFLACVIANGFEASRRQIGVYSLTEGRLVKSFPTTKLAAPYNRLRWEPGGGAIVYKDAAQGMWRQPVESGKPEKLPILEDIRVFHFSYTPDGEMLFSGGRQLRKILIFENF